MYTEKRIRIVLEIESFHLSAYTFILNEQQNKYDSINALQ